MTVVPGVDSGTMKLICDHCGDVAVGSARSIRDADADVVWPLTAQHGWTGSPFAAGPHHCPDCAASGLLRAGEPDREAAPPEDDRSLRIDYRLAAAVVEFAGDIDLAGAERLRQALVSAGAVRRCVVLDLGHAGLIDSTGLGALVRAHRDLKHRGGTLCLAAPSRFVVTVLHTMRLDVLFPTFDDREQALAYLSGGGAQGP